MVKLKCLTPMNTQCHTKTKNKLKNGHKRNLGNEIEGQVPPTTTPLHSIPGFFVWAGVCFGLLQCRPKSWLQQSLDGWMDGWTNNQTPLAVFLDECVHVWMNEWAMVADWIRSEAPAFSPIVCPSIGGPNLQDFFCFFAIFFNSPGCFFF